MASSLRLRVLFCAIVASLGTFNCGINTSVLNIPGHYVYYTCPGDHLPGTSLPLCIPMGDWIWGLVNGMFALGGLIGAMVGGRLSEKFGRRDSMLMINITFLIGAALSATATTSVQLAIGRVFVGVGSGSMYTIVPMYIAEIAPTSHRGALVGILQLFGVLGVFIIEAVGIGLQSYVGWRIATAITAIPTALQILGLPFCIRSPRWLISQNRLDEARAALLKVRKDGDIELEFAEMVGNNTTLPRSDQDKIVAEYASTIEVDSSSNQNNRVTFFDMMRIPVLAKLILKMMVIHAGFHLTGINAVMYYSTTLFAAAYGSAAAYISVGVAAVNVVTTMVALLVVDRLGRKVLMLWSTAGMCVTCGLMTASLCVGIPPLQVVSIILYVGAFAIGLGIVPFLYVAECFPTYAVGAACSASLVSNWLCNFIVGFLFPSLLTACGNYVFLIFAVVSLVMVVFIYFAATETKCKSIEEIGRELGWYGIDVSVVTKSSS
ncbi:general substrate transporter [Dichotomocladium elegans]|nr:general substrate transporter [Dichotomocladium elegans]